MFPVLLIALLVAGPATGAAPAPVGDHLSIADDRRQTGQATPAVVTDQPRIVEVYPNPTVNGDDGEFVTLWLPSDTRLDAYTLGDGEATIRLSSLSNLSIIQSPDENDTAGYYVTLSTNRTMTSSLTDRTVLEIPGRLQLANGGETVRLSRDGTVVDEVSYGQAPEGEVYDARNGTWNPLGGTDRPIVTAKTGTVEAFVLPDESERAVEFLETASERILLAGYTLSSERVVETLQAASQRNVSVEVLVEGRPVGGMTTTQAKALDELQRTGVTVRVVGGKRARYRYHHAKYAIVDDSALVTTENWKASGVGGRSSRGWGLITAQDRIVDGLVETYRADAGWVDAISWESFDPEELTEPERTNGSYPTAFESKSLPVERTRLLVTPDNADGAITATIDSAEESIAVKQMSIGSPGFSFLQAVLDAARRGVEVRILLSGAWYVQEENRQLKGWLDDQADAENLPLDVRIADPEGAFGKIHAKGIIVDGKTTILGSINWNDNSLRENREVALLVESEAVADYFRAVFESDWGSNRQQIPFGYLAACGLAAVVALLAATRLQFDGR